MYHHVNSMTKKWEKRYSYGGMWTENVVQAAARDLLASAMLRLEKAGYPPVMTIHDEVVADVPNRHGNLKEFLNIMEDNPQWAKDLPVVAEGWEGQRYRK
jgi:DNA polymerase